MNIRFLVMVAALCVCSTASAQDFWTRPVTALAGPVDDLALDSNGTLYASSSDGVYAAASGEDRWRLITRPQWADDYNAISAGNGFVAVATLRHGVMQTTDGGASWSRTLEWPSGSALTGFAAHPGTGAMLAGAIDTEGDQVVVRSTNKGGSWQVVLAGPRAAGLLIVPDGTAFVSRDSGIMRSVSPVRDDWSFVLRESQFGGGPMARMSDGVILAASYTYGMLRSTDNGITWSEGNDGLPRGYIGRISTAANREALVTVGDTLYHSTNSGAGWSPLDTSANTIVVLRDRTGALVRADAFGVSRSTDNGATWSDASDGLNTAIVTGIVELGDRSLMAVQMNGRLHRSTNGGRNWSTERSLSDRGTRGAYGLAVDTASGDLYVPAFQYGLLRSSDTGRTWARVDAVTGSVDAVNALPGGRIAALNGQMLFISSDRGATWSTDTVLPRSSMTFGVIESRGALYVAAFYGIYRSTDGGASWERVVTQLSYSIAVDERGRLFAGSEGIVQRSDDDGATWDLAAYTTNDRGWRLAIGPGGVVVLGRRDFGVSISKDGGESFEHQSSGQYNPSLMSLTVGRDGRVFVGSDGSGIFYSTVPVTSSAPDENATRRDDPNEAVLTALPNPALGESVVTARLARSGHVSVRLFDATGALVTTLCDAGLDAGLYRFAVPSLAAGAYRCVMSVDGGAATSRPLIIQ